MRKLIVCLMLLFFSVNVFAWDITENHYVTDKYGNSHRLATPTTTRSATNAGEAAEIAGVYNGFFSVTAFACFAIAALTSIIQYFLAPETPETNSDGSVKNHARKWAVYAGSFLGHAVFCGLSYFVCRIFA
ncbi:hypothetical protein AGMMS49929_10630 [Endomicrobiia bacterium]|nr:hypothetical protein AGMMS49571_10930 [Endomicrobiia bacterium]GHT21727.1 hypothetical protein AGMMS49929_10630 [Endomicrobiia bacterium]GHT28951.1 hypothetical protein AGMMS49995_10630 [Endomicrobiia bacterium]